MNIESNTIWSGKEGLGAEGFVVYVVDVQDDKVSFRVIKYKGGEATSPLFEAETEVFLKDYE